MVNKKKKPVNVICESAEAVKTPDSPEAQYISKLNDMADNNPFVRLKNFFIDSRGGRVYEFEVDEGYVSAWEEYKRSVMEEVGYNV